MGLDAQGKVEPKDFTALVFAAIRKRSKAIKYRGADIDVDRVREVERGVSIEKMRISVTYRPTALVRLTAIVWPDRWTWVDVRRRGKPGWAWVTTMQGRFIDSTGAGELVDSIEATLDASHEEEAVSQIEKIWRPRLAQGPQRV